jgi:hypothetical protein
MRLVSHVFVSWNQLDGWLRQIEGLRFVARLLAVGGNGTQDLPA